MISIVYDIITYYNTVGIINPPPNIAPKKVSILKT